MGAYKQFLTSDLIVAPFEVHKDFSFTYFATSSTITLPSGLKATVPGPNYFGGSYPGVGITRFLGRNIDYFDFNKKVDPITGDYITTGLGTVSSVNLNIAPFHNEVIAIGSSSFNLNGINVVLTGSTPPPNQGNVVYIKIGGNAVATTTNIVGKLNVFSPFYFDLSNINAVQDAVLPGPILQSKITFYSRTREFINNYYYVTSASITTNFSSGSNNTVSGSYQYQRLVYRSIQELYYSNYTHCEFGDSDLHPILVPGADSNGNVYVGSNSSQAHYYNYLQTTLSYPRFYPTASDAIVGILTIPNTLFGDYIQPNSLYIRFPFNNQFFEFYDDGEGNLRMLNNFYGTSSAIVGNVIYPHGIVTFVGNRTLYDYYNAYANGDLLTSTYASSIYGTTFIYGDILNIPGLINAFVSSSNFTSSFSSSYTIYETQYKCTIRENEYNYTLNPSTFTSTSSSIVNTNLGGSPCAIDLSSSNDIVVNPGVPYDYVNQDYFSPYITTVGLYDEQQNLLAVGKLSQPLPSSPTTDTTILINIDR